MVNKKDFISLLLFLLVCIIGCTVPEESGIDTAQAVDLISSATQIVSPSATVFNPTTTENVIAQPSETPTQTPSLSNTSTPTPTETEPIFEVGQEITIQNLRDSEIISSEIIFEQKLQDRSNYHQHLVSYISEGNKIYGLLTIPFEEPSAGGYKAIVFNHGYIPPTAYQTTERYTAYVDYLARNGFVVFKIDYRGHGNSEGEPTGSYFSPGYTIDSITALKSLQMMEIIDPEGIGMWGHSMAGNLVLRAMLIESDIKAGVIWAGAVYSYDDFVKYGIDDNTYRPPAPPEAQGTPDPRRRRQTIFETYGPPDTRVDFWKAVSLTENIEFLNNPLQLHHAEDDTVVNIGYSFDLAGALQENGKAYEFYIYKGGGHNLISPYFEQAMQRAVAFFQENL